MSRAWVGIIVEHVSHGRAKDAAAKSGGGRATIPSQRLGPVLVVKIAARSPGSPVHPSEPSRVQHHRVAMVAKRTNLGTAPPGIKGMVTPFDLSNRTHAVSPANSDASTEPPRPRLHGINRAGEIGDDAITCGVDDATRS